jgi:hypothetical protein
MDFIVNGRHHSLTKQEVEARLRGVTPGPIYRYAIEVNGVLYPVKQVFAVATGVDQFTTQRARDVLRRLGFPEPGDAGGSATVPTSGRPVATKPAPSPVWVLEIRTVGAGSHEFELADTEDIQAIRDAISHSIGSDGFYQGRARRCDAVGGISEFTIAWTNVAAAALYQRPGHSAS